MQISLHKKARTTPAVRAEIATSQEPVARLARRFSVTAPLQTHSPLETHTQVQTHTMLEKTNGWHDPRTSVSSREFSSGPRRSTHGSLRRNPT